MPILPNYGVQGMRMGTSIMQTILNKQAEARMRARELAAQIDRDAQMAWYQKNQPFAKTLQDKANRAASGAAMIIDKNGNWSYDTNIFQGNKRRPVAPQSVVPPQPVVPPKQAPLPPYPPPPQQQLGQQIPAASSRAGYSGYRYFKNPYAMPQQINVAQTPPTQAAVQQQTAPVAPMPQVNGYRYFKNPYAMPQQFRVVP